MRIRTGSSIILTASVAFATAIKVATVYADDLQNTPETEVPEISEPASSGEFNLYQLTQNAEYVSPFSYKGRISSFFDRMVTTAESRMVTDAAKYYLLNGISKTYSNYAVELPEDSLEKVAFETLMEFTLDPEVTDPLEYAEYALSAASRSLDPYTRFPDKPLDQAPAAEATEDDAEDVVTSRIIESAVGYLKISEFSENSAELSEAAIEDLVSRLHETERGYILDLRNNPGGGVAPAEEIADSFLERGVIYDTISQGRVSAPHNAEAGDLINGKPLIVLINRGSASASELVAGALKFNRRAIVIGEPSFQKGVIQTIMPQNRANPTLQSTEYRITTSFYRVGDTRFGVHHNGILPDILVNEHTGNARTERDLPNSLPPPPSFIFSLQSFPRAVCVNTDLNTIESDDPIGLVIEQIEMDRTLECALEALGLDRPLVEIIPFPQPKPNMQAEGEDLAFDPSR